MNPLTVLITGPRGVGKTTLCLRTVALAKEAHYSCAGLLTLREDDDRRVVVDVRTGDRRSLTATGPGGVPVGRYVFDPGALAWGAEVLAHSTPCDLLVVDELGPLEMAGDGWAVGMDVLREGRFLLALVVVRPELVAEALERFPDAWALEVTPENRDGLPVWLAGLLPPRGYPL
jgi:nucleoside-triphosphatase THEP1